MIKFIFILFNSVFSFQLNKCYIPKKNNLIKMNYEFMKNYDDKINILPKFQTRIIINNWIDYLSSHDENNFPNYILETIYDFKIFIAINKQETNLIYLAWCPDLKYKVIVYLIACKFIGKDNLEIYRIAQNPYYKNILNINSIDLLKDIKINNPNLNLTYNELYKYDNRWYLSWKYKDI